MQQWPFLGESTSFCLEENLEVQWKIFRCTLLWPGNFSLAVQREGGEIPLHIQMCSSRPFEHLE